MNKILVTVFGIISLAIMTVVFPIVLDSTHEIQVNSYSQAAAGVATGAGVTTADVVLTFEAWGDTNAAVTSVTSDNGADTPAIGAYAAATDTLTVTGLAAADTRALTIVYDTDALTSYTGMSAMVGVTPMLAWIAIIGVVIGGLFLTWRGQGGGG